MISGYSGMDLDRNLKDKNTITEMNKKNPEIRVCVVSYPFTLSHKTPVYCLLFNFLEIIQSISQRVFIISGNIPNQEIPQDLKNHFINIEMETELKTNRPLYLSFPIWILNFIYGQIIMSFYLIQIAMYVDVVIFFIGYDYVLPAITAKLLRKKTIIIVTMSSKSIKETYNTFFYSLSRCIETICYSIVDCLVVDPQNESLIKNEKYKKKIELGARHVNLNQFKITKTIHERSIIIGYIGRFSEEKGIRNFLAAISIILKDHNDIKFFIGGDGLLFDEVTEKIKSFPQDKIIATKWIPQLELPQYLNNLKLIVIPSYTETGPFIALEAIACGTPVLATSVGLIPDIITDGKTGFLLADNSPDTIAKNIFRVLNCQNLEEIVENAREKVENEFTFQAAVNTYTRIFKKISD